MIIGGYQKLTLIDYPGKLATTVFTVGCNFRCPFCHNPELVNLSLPHGNIMEKEFFDFLRKRKGKLEAVCITGGEPTLQSDLEDFIKKIKRRGLLVKLDSNGMRPDIIKKLLDKKLLDYIAMDIKSSLKNYGKTVGTKVDKDRIKLSVELVRHSGIGYEFRTTVVPGLHTEEDFEEIGKWLQGAKKYYLQVYRDQIILNPRLKKKTNGKSLDLKKIFPKILK